MTEKEAAKIAKDVASISKQLSSILGQSEMIDRLLAKHPNAAAGLLEKLSHSGDKTTRKNVALNPNADKEVLLALAPQFPLDFFRNPAFDWLLLEDPDLLLNLGKGVLKNILKRPECPESFMQWASRHGGEQEMLAVAMNPAAPLDALQRLGSHDGPVGLAAQSHEKLGSIGPLPDAAIALENEVKSELGKMDAGTACIHWRRGVIGPEQWQWLGIRARLAVLGLCDGVYLNHWVAHHADQLAHDADPLVRLPASRRTAAEQLTENSISTDPAKLQMLAQLKLMQETQARVWWRQLTLRAKKPFKTETAAVLPVKPDIAELVELLRQEANFLVLYPAGSLLARVLGIACGDVMAIPGETVGAACNSNARVIRLLGLRNPKAGPDALAKRCKSTDWVERLAIAGNPACPSSILSALKHDAHQLVAQQAHATELVKADDVARKQAMVASSSDDLDLGAIVSELSARLRKECRPWFLPDTPWWNCLTFEQRVGEPGQSWMGQALQSFPYALSVVAHHPDLIVRKSIASTPSTPAATLAILANDPEDSVREQVASNRATSIDVLAVLAQDQDEMVRYRVACRRDLTTSMLDGFVADANEYVRAGAAGNILTSPQVLDVLATDKVEDVRDAAARNGALPPVAMRALARDKSVDVRLALSWNTDIPLEIVEILASDKNEVVRCGVADNSATPENILTALAQDKKPSVRADVAGNIRTPSDVLFTLAQDKNKDVRMGLAENRFAPILLLAQLARDRAYRVASAADENNTSNAMSVLAAAAQIHTADVELRRLLARNTLTPVEVLESLVSDQDALVRVRLASNVSTPPMVLSGLTRDADGTVREYAVKNWSTPLSSLELLSGDGNYNVREYVAKKISIPELLAVLAHDETDSVRKVVASNPNTPASVLELLGKDKDTFVRWAVQNNDATPLEVVCQLKLPLARQASNAVLSRRQVATLCIEAQSSTVSAERLLEMGRSGYLVVRLAAIGNPSYPAARHDADLADVLATIESAMTSPPFIVDHAALQVADLLLPLAALNLLPSASDAKQIAKAAKSKDWIERAGAALCEGVQPHLLRMLLDDEVALVRQLAIRRIKEVEAI